MQPARAAPAVPLVYQPLCWRPSICDNNHCGALTRWSHVNLRSGSIRGSLDRAGWLSRPSSSGEFREWYRWKALENRTADLLIPPLRLICAATDTLASGSVYTVLAGKQGEFKLCGPGRRQQQWSEGSRAMSNHGP